MKAPPVTMLWEDVDAPTALTERFGLADATAAHDGGSSTGTARWLP